MWHETAWNRMDLTGKDHGFGLKKLRSAEGLDEMMPKLNPFWTGKMDEILMETE